MITYEEKKGQERRVRESDSRIACDLSIRVKSSLCFLTIQGDDFIMELEHFLRFTLCTSHCTGAKGGGVRKAFILSSSPYQFFLSKNCGGEGIGPDTHARTTHARASLCDV